MKYYIRIALLVYLLVSVGILYWWSQSSARLVGGSDHSRAISLYQIAKANRYGEIRAQRNISEREHFNTRDPYISFLLSGQERFCGGNFIGYKNAFAKLTNVIVDTSFAQGRRGGEDLQDVMDQPEEDEYYDITKGFFQMTCSEDFHYVFGDKSHLNKWLDCLDPRVTPNFELLYEIPQWTLAIQRYEYVNIYHTMTDWYNAFLVCKVFKVDPEDVTVLIIDGHPAGGLDETWEQLFGEVVRLGDIRKPVIFNTMVWGMVGYDSPLNEHYLPDVSFLEEFRTFFLSRHHITPDDNLNCDKLNIVIIWRRDYLAHPRNPSGLIHRKIKNEDELLKKVSDVFKGHNVSGVQTDAIPMKQQLEIASKTDILIGMHGAGMAHTLFLPKHSGVIEMFPSYFPDTNIPFRAMTQWRHMYYLSWSNYNSARELDGFYTMVDVDEVANLAKEMGNKLCRQKESSK